MEESIHQLWIFAQWGFGLSFTGFLFLLGMMLRVGVKMTKPLQEIRDALIGNYDKPGLITRHYKLEEIVDTNKKACDLKHPKAAIETP